MEVQRAPSNREGRWAGWLLLASASALAVLIALVQTRLGPIAVSDDDFARVVIAERFALTPRFDPSGTSWLPFPFYLDGAAVLFLGQGLEGPRLAALIRTGVGASLLVASGRLLGLTRGLSLLAGLLPGLLQSVAIFAVATVPEYFTACLATFGCITLLGRAPPPFLRTCLALVCLLCATLSRYETWPFAAALAACLFANRDRRGITVGLLCLAGPLLWLAHGALHHGSPWFFVDRVRSYKLALGSDARTHLEILSSYVHGLVMSEPVIVMGAGLAILSSASAVRRRILWILLPALSQLGFLTVSDLLSGSPTHHPERLLMVFWTMLPLVTCFAFRQALAQRPLFVGAALALVVVSRFLPHRPEPDYADRSDEEAVGRKLSALQDHRPAPTLIASLDFSYFATIASAGWPDRFVAITVGDPRQRSDQPIASRVREALGQSGSEWLVAPLCIDPDSLWPDPRSPLETRFESKNYRILKRIDPKQ